MSAGRTWAATRLWLRDLRRRPLLLVLLVVTPVFFITRSIAATQPIPRAVGLPGGGVALSTMRDIHGATMAAITVAFLSGLVGVFIMQAAQQADRRLVLAGFRSLETVASRYLVLLTATGIITAVSLLVTTLDFDPRSFVGFAVATTLVAATYAGIGALAGSLLGRVGATYLVLFLAMTDLGIAQNPMFGSGSPPGWALALPGYPAMRVVIAASFADDSVVPTVELIGALTWVVVVSVAVIAILGWSLQRPRRAVAR
ncbi:MAG: hypothetical protein WEC34_03040 [Acidimicrobiia bacterium]